MMMLTFILLYIINTRSEPPPHPKPLPPRGEGKLPLKVRIKSYFLSSPLRGEDKGGGEINIKYIT
jgi:hypothetical protein